MMSKRRSLLVAIMVAILVVSVLPVLPSQVAATNDPGPGNWTVTDWVVDSDKTYRNVTINVTNHVYIQANLTLYNVTLNLMPPSNSTTKLLAIHLMA